MSRILVVEDNENLRSGLRDLLESEGFEVIEAADGQDALRLVTETKPDLLLLDLMLPGLAGERVLRLLQAGDARVPILVLTAKREEDDKVRAFLLGADDYVTKPFGRKELTARIGALLRRASRAPKSHGDSSSAAPPASTLTFGDIVVDPRTHVVTRGDLTVALAPKEFDLLLALMHREGGVATREELLRDVWGYQSDVKTRTVDLHMLELRRKLEVDPTRPQHLLTVRKLGYRFSGTP